MDYANTTEPKTINKAVEQTIKNSVYTPCKSLEELIEKYKPILIEQLPKTKTEREQIYDATARHATPLTYQATCWPKPLIEKFTPWMPLPPEGLDMLYVRRMLYHDCGLVRYMHEKNMIFKPIGIIPIPVYVPLFILWLSAPEGFDPLEEDFMPGVLTNYNLMHMYYTVINEMNEKGILTEQETLNAIGEEGASFIGMMEKLYEINKDIFLDFGNYLKTRTETPDIKFGEIKAQHFFHNLNALHTTVLAEHAKYSWRMLLRFETLLMNKLGVPPHIQEVLHTSQVVPKKVEFSPLCKVQMSLGKDQFGQIIEHISQHSVLRGGEAISLRRTFGPVSHYHLLAEDKYFWGFTDFLFSYAEGEQVSSEPESKRTNDNESEASSSSSGSAKKRELPNDEMDVV